MDGCQQYPRWAGTRAEGLVGRCEELALIDSFLKGSAAEGGVLLLTGEPDRKSTRLNSSHSEISRMPSSA